MTNIGSSFGQGNARSDDIDGWGRLETPDATSPGGEPKTGGTHRAQMAGGHLEPSTIQSPFSAVSRGLKQGALTSPDPGFASPTVGGAAAAIRYVAEQMGVELSGAGLKEILTDSFKNGHFDYSAARRAIKRRVDQ